MQNLNNATPQRSKSNNPGSAPPPPPPPMPAVAAKAAASSLSVKQMVKDAHGRNASDIHIRVGQVPRFRIRGEMVRMGDQPKVTEEIFNTYLEEILNPAQRQKFAEEKELDTAIFYPG